MQSLRRESAEDRKTRKTADSGFPPPVPVLIPENTPQNPSFFRFRGCLFPEYGVFYLIVMIFST